MLGTILKWLDFCYQMTHSLSLLSVSFLLFSLSCSLRRDLSYQTLSQRTRRSSNARDLLQFYPLTLSIPVLSTQSLTSHLPIQTSRYAFGLFRTNSILNPIASAKACIDTRHVERTVLMPSDLWLPRYSCFAPRKSVFPVCKIKSNIVFLFKQLQTPANVFILF